MESLTTDTINAFVSSNDKVIVVFFAEWCPFCRAFLKIIENNKSTLKHKLAFANISEDTNKLWSIYGISHIPVVIAFSNGKILARKDAIPNLGLNQDDLLTIDRALGS